MIGERGLRILHTEASLGWGGQEIRILTEAEKFEAEGHSVHLLCDPDSDIFAAAGRYGVACTAVAMKRKSPRGLLAIRRFLRAWNPDVVNTHSSIDHWLTAMARAGWKTRPAIVRTRHIGAPVSRGSATRWLYNSGCEGVMATSRSIVAALTNDGFLPPDRVRAVPTGIDTTRYVAGDRGEARTTLRLPRGDFVFVIVATLRSWKGHACLLEALSHLPSANARLLVVGDGPQEQNLRRRIAALGLDERVALTGRQADVLPYLHAADAFVLPSTANEGVPQAMLQAMACRLPIVACPVGGIVELLDGLSAVYPAEPGNSHSLARAMGAAMSDAVSERDRDALRDRVARGYSLEQMYVKALRSFETAVTSIDAGYSKKSIVPK